MNERKSIVAQYSFVMMLCQIFLNLRTDITLSGLQKWQKSKPRISVKDRAIKTQKQL